MLRRAPRSTCLYTLIPSTTLVRSSLFGVLPSICEGRGQLLGEWIVVDRVMQLEVQQQAARVPVGAADHRVRAVDNEQFAVTERPGLEADAHAALQQLRELVLGGPTDIRKIVALRQQHDRAHRSEEHTSELQSLMRISYAVFCLKKKTIRTTQQTT